METTPAAVQTSCDNINPDDDRPQNSESENDRGARYWHDCHHLLTLLPKEVWHLIGTFLENQDILNLTNSSLFFRDIFVKKQIFHLFLPVLEILLQKLEHSPSDQDYQEQLLGALLDCRETCKTWKQLIDQKACDMSLDQFKAKNLISYILSKNFTSKNSSEIDKFLQYFQESHPSSKNPSPAKYIDLHIRLVEEDYPQLINRISTLLNKFGEHIWTFQVSIMFGRLNPIEFHEKFVQWLNFLPNLQNLQIFCFVPLRVKNVEKVNLKNVPVNLNLRKLAVETFIAPLKDEDIPNWSWMERYNFSKLLINCDNLNCLEITIFNKLDVKILERVNSPLKWLVVEFYCKEDEINLGEVFNILSKFSASLENLRLTFRVNSKPSGHMKVIRDCFRGRLNLKRVRKFEINILRIYFLDFLLGMKDNLEELVINCEGLRGYGDGDFSEVETSEIGLMEGGQIINFLRWQDKMDKSNIWEAFPKLKRICVVRGNEIRRFKRENWKKI